MNLTQFMDVQFRSLKQFIICYQQTAITILGIHAAFYTFIEMP